MSSHRIADGSFRRISGTILLLARGRQETPIIALQAMSRDAEPKRLTLSMRNTAPHLPNGERYPLFRVSLDDMDGQPSLSAPAPNFISFVGPVRFRFENPSPGRFTYQLTYSLPDGSSDMLEGEFEMPAFDTKDVALLCVGAPFEVSDIQVDQ